MRALLDVLLEEDRSLAGVSDEDAAHCVRMGRSKALRRLRLRSGALSLALGIESVIKLSQFGALTLDLGIKPIQLPPAIQELPRVLRHLLTHPGEIPV